MPYMHIRPLHLSLGRWSLRAASGLLLCAFLTGCAALTNPVANGVPVRRLPPELLGESKQGLETIPLTLLRQPPPAAYKLAGGDVLGVWIEGILGERGQSPPLHIPEAGNLPPALGYPIPVSDDGTIALPFIEPLRVQGMKLAEAQEAIRKAYTVDRKILQPAQARITVTLQRPRVYHILVIREDTSGGGEAAAGGTGLRAGARATGFVIGVGGGSQGVRRGTGFAIDLPAYNNDLLNALAVTGGFPGTDAVNEIVIERGSFADSQGREGLMNNLQACPAGTDLFAFAAAGTRKIRIPLRVRPGEPLNIRSEDIILETGDIVYIKAREADVFYTSGLLPAGEYTLPRDTDLDVIDAITRVSGAINSGGLGTFNISGQLITPGFGFPSPSLVNVIRRTPEGGIVNIRVDLNKALHDPDERLLIQPKDLIMLQERPEEAIARYLEETFHFSFVYTFVNSSRALGTASAISPIGP